jgi:S-DNA-T family DNA segregation ATPase FtsK/SpoIIIE
MANKSPQRSTRTNSKPINAKAAADKPPRKPKGVVKNEGKAPRPSHVVNLINDTLWLLALAAAIFCGALAGELHHDRSGLVAQRGRFR